MKGALLLLLLQSMKSSRTYLIFQWPASERLTPQHPINQILCRGPL